MRIPGAGEPVFKARARLAQVARRLGFDAETVDGIILAFTEAVTNAIVYGNASARHCVRVQVGVENGRLLIDVSDHGRGFHPDQIKLPPADCMCEGGRGLFLMRALMDEVDWIASPTGTTVRMTKCCTSPSPLRDPVPNATASPGATSQTPTPAVSLPAIQ